MIRSRKPSRIRAAARAAPKAALGALALAALSACTHMDFDDPREPSFARPAGDARAARIARDLTGGEPDRVALAPLGAGNDALGARLGMIESAERSIDIQTFLIKPGGAQAVLWRALRAAAGRGVRVRLLFDDALTTLGDARIAALDAHPNIQIRAFNPLSRRSPALFSYLFAFDRANRRMHNKAFIMDGAYAILGGRNIADEYFQVGPDSDFGDLGLFLAGAAVQDLSAAFDLYWNDRWAVPVSRLHAGAATAAEPEAGVGAEARALRARAVNSRYLSRLRAGRVERFTGEARIVVDPPAKLRRPPGAGPAPVAEAFWRRLGAARSEVVVVTPYLIPTEDGMRAFEALLARGVRVAILTNSLASTNHPYVHGHYARYRRRLLAAGAEIREIRADAPRRLGLQDAALTLHTKLAILDRETLFVGSGNLDPRSMKQNSEIAAVIDSPALAAHLARGLARALKDHAFRVGLAPDGSLVWVYEGRAGQAILGSEPGAGALDRMLSTISAWLPVEDQL